MKKMIGLLLGLAVLSVPIAYAGTGRDAVILQGREVIREVVKQYPQICVQDTFTTDLIGLGQIKNYTTFLYAGVNYLIAVGGDDNARDLDIALIDGRGNPILDDANRKEGFVTVEVLQTGTFYLNVRLTSGSRNGAWIYIIHFYSC